MAGFSGGVYTRVHNWKNDRLADIAITDSRMDEEDDSIAAALSMCVLKDGTQTIMADISMSNHRITNLADAQLTPSVIGHHALNVQTADGRYVLAGDAGGAMTGPLIITSAHQYALCVGPEGGTDPTFWVDPSATDCATGLRIIGQKAGDSVYLDVQSSGANESLVVRSKGTGVIDLTAPGGVVLRSTPGPITMVSAVAAQTPQVDANVLSGANGDLTGSIVVQNKYAVTPPEGDYAQAAIVFQCSGKFVTKMALRSDGVFSIGGYSATSYKWYIDLATGNTFATGVMTAPALTLSHTAPIISFIDTDWGTHKLMASGATIGFMNNAQTVWMMNMNQDTNNMYVGGAITAGGDVSTQSDGRMKTGVRTIGEALAFVRSMRGVHYTKLGTGELKAGVIAQELQVVAPELVSEKDGLLNVAYGNLVAYLIEAIKQLDREIRGREPA